MRKILVGIMVIVVSIGLAACSPKEVVSPTAAPTTAPTQTATSLPMPTPDPCAKFYIAETIKPMTHWMNAFDDTTALASITMQNSTSWTTLILDLQQSRRNFAELELPSCLQQLQRDGIAYMNETISYLATFMQGVDPKELSTPIANTQNLRTVYEKEKAQLLGEEFTLLPTTGPANVTPTP
jgi:hypothetical protein